MITHTLRGTSLSVPFAWLFRLLWNLSTMPDANDPYRLLPDPVEESIGLNVHLTVRQVGELGHKRAGIGEFRQPLERLLGALSELLGGLWTLVTDRSDRGEEL